MYRHLSREMNARAMVSNSAYEARSERLGVTCVANFMRWRPRPLRRRNSLQFQVLVAAGAARAFRAAGLQLSNEISLSLFLMTCNKNQLSLLGSMCQLLRQQLSISTSPLSLEPLLSAGVWVAGVARIHHPHLLIIFGVDLMLGRDSTLTLFLGTSAEPMRACL